MRLYQMSPAFRRCQLVTDHRPALLTSPVHPLLSQSLSCYPLQQVYHHHWSGLGVMWSSQELKPVEHKQKGGKAWWSLCCCKCLLAQGDQTCSLLHTCKTHRPWSYHMRVVPEHNKGRVIGVTTSSTDVDKINRKTRKTHWSSRENHRVKEIWSWW